jgi:MtN3 and saliva related transmembrane protein
MSSQIEILGLMAACLTTLCWLPQAWRTMRTRDTRSLSLITQAALTAGVGLWLLYGILLGNLALILANGVSIVPLSIILAMKARHG